MATEDTSKSREGARWFLPVVLLVLTVVVLALAAIVSLRRPGPTPDPGKGPERITAEVILAKARPLIEADKYAAGPLARRALDQAIDLMLVYVQAHPDDVKVRPLLAEAQIKSGDLTAAERTVGRLLALGPDHAAPLWLKGEIMRLRGDDAYVEFYRRATESTGATAQMFSMYGLLLAGRGEHDPARKYLQRALDGGVRSSDVLVSLGRIAMGRSEYGRAGAFLDEAVRLDQQNAELWRLLASCHQQAGRADAAADTLRQAARKVKRWTDKASLWAALGRVLEAQGRDADAAESFAAASDGTPNLPDRAFGAARCYFRTGRYALAMKYIDRAAAIDPHDRDIRDWLEKIEEARFARPVSPDSTTSPAPGGATVDTPAR
ncbi:MAG: tetratricopeptide repeat protein [Phycisphaerae bacterium]|nr:tetratricopeptide repeat protein [Phycisphaerae bacterium]